MASYRYLRGRPNVVTSPGMCSRSVSAERIWWSAGGGRLGSREDAKWRSGVILTAKSSLP